MVKYQAFHSICRLGDSVEATNPVTVTLQEVTDEWFPLLKEHQEYLGLVDNLGTTIQMLYNEENDNYWIKVPRADLNGSYGRRVDFNGAKTILRSLETPFPVDGFDGFEFGSW